MKKIAILVLMFALPIAQAQVHNPSLPPGWTVTGGGASQVVTAPGTVAAGTTNPVTIAAVQAVLALGSTPRQTAQDAAIQVGVVLPQTHLQRRQQVERHQVQPSTAQRR